MDDLNRRTYEQGSGGGSGAMLFIVGAVVGAAAALILAPAAGRDTRAFLNRRGKELATARPSASARSAVRNSPTT